MIALLNPPGTYTIMLFEISRTSRYDGTSPVEGAFEMQRPRVDRRTVSSPDQLRYEPERSTWYQRGANHRVEDGCIVRDMEMETVWMIEIESLDALMAFVDEQGRIVLAPGHIEIYDDYRE